MKFNAIDQEVEVELRASLDTSPLSFSGIGYAGNETAVIFLGELWRISENEKDFTEYFIDVLNHEILEVLGIPHEWIVEMNLENLYRERTGPLPIGTEKLE